MFSYNHSLQKYEYKIEANKGNDNYMLFEVQFFNVKNNHSDRLKPKLVLQARQYCNEKKLKIKMFNEDYLVVTSEYCNETLKSCEFINGDGLLIINFDQPLLTDYSEIYFRLLINEYQHSYHIENMYFNYLEILPDIFFNYHNPYLFEFVPVGVPYVYSINMFWLQRVYDGNYNYVSIDKIWNMQSQDPTMILQEYHLPLDIIKCIKSFCGFIDVCNDMKFYQKKNIEKQNEKHYALIFQSRTECHESPLLKC